MPFKQPETVPGETPEQTVARLARGLELMPTDSERKMSAGEGEALELVPLEGGSKESRADSLDTLAEQVLAQNEADQKAADVLAAKIVGENLVSEGGSASQKGVPDLVNEAVKHEAHVDAFKKHQRQVKQEVEQAEALRRQKESPGYVEGRRLVEAVEYRYRDIPSIQESFLYARKMGFDPDKTQRDFQSGIILSRPNTQLPEYAKYAPLVAKELEDGLDAIYSKTGR